MTYANKADFNPDVSFWSMSNLSKIMRFSGQMVMVYARCCSTSFAVTINRARQVNSMLMMEESHRNGSSLVYAVDLMGSVIDANV